ncbi:hypothetical protein NDU88_010595 [Pleurodeles waltl]|uniref:Uncharacterized protein n=1 Tax=Pleurodeles waltl TaxID=8319 RepID=A0AAV7S192_PLEWA|nr:hypothetical protein NDU88_010595 [Pleurodeles waltl]
MGPTAPCQELGQEDQVMEAVRSHAPARLWSQIRECEQAPRSNVTVAGCVCGVPAVGTAGGANEQPRYEHVQQFVTTYKAGAHKAMVVTVCALVRDEGARLKKRAYEDIISRRKNLCGGN